MFIAPPGFAYLQGDLSKAEATYVAYDAQEEELIDILTNPKRDLYAEVASESLRQPITKKNKERELFKRCIHGAHYGMGYGKTVQVLRLNGIYIRDVPIPELSFDMLVETNPKFRAFYREDENRARNTFRRLGSDDRKAGFVIESYMLKFKRIRPWQDEIGKEVKATRTLTDAFGRRRVFLGRMDDDLIRKALSFKPQGTVVGITNRALRVLDSQGYEIVLQVHDSLGMYVEEQRIDEAAFALQQAMTCPLLIHGRTMTISTDIQLGRSWGELNDWQPGRRTAQGELS